MVIVVGAPWPTVSTWRTCKEQHSRLTFHDLAGLNVPAQEAGMWVGDNQASGAFSECAFRAARLVARDSNQSVVEVARLRRRLPGLTESPELVEVVALHHLESAVSAEEDNIVDADVDRSWSCSNQCSAGGKSKDLSEVHCELETESITDRYRRA